MYKSPFFFGKDWLKKLTPFSIVKPYLADLLLITFMINLLSLAMPLTLLQIYDRILRYESIHTLNMLLLGVFVALFFESLLRLGRSYIQGWIGSKFQHLVTCRAMEHLLNGSLDPFEKDSVGIHLERLNAIHILKDFYSGQAALMVLDMPFALVFLGLIYHLAGMLVLVPLVIFGFFLLAAWYYRAALYRKVKENMKTDDERIDFIIETLTGIHSVKALSLESKMSRRYEQLLEKCVVTARDVGLQGSNSQHLGMFFSQASTVGVVAFGSVMVINQGLTVGGLVACSMLAGRSLQPLQSAVGIWARFQAIRIARERLGALFSSSNQDVEQTIRQLHGRIQLNGVSFHSNPSLPPLLNNLSLTVAAGETVGIIGGNGSGKSTLLNLIMGTIQPTTGEVLIDGIKPSHFDPDIFHNQVAYLPQEGVLFKGTILENLHMFREENSDLGLASAKRLGLDDFCPSLPKGYGTLIDDGVYEAIPRGVKQRIAIARALALSPRIILFDEANTAIDGRGDEKLKDVLKQVRGKATLLLVSHRPSLLRLSDRIFELKEGCLVPLSAKSSKPNQTMGP